MAECNPITNLDELIKKGAGLVDRPKIVTIRAGSYVLEVKNLTDDEVLDYVQDLSDIGAQGGRLKDELKFVKKSIYLHCPILQQYADQVENENRAEPWDVLEELFTPAERNMLRNDFYNKTGISKFNGVTGEESAKNE